MTEDEFLNLDGTAAPGAAPTAAPGAAPTAAPAAPAGMSEQEFLQAPAPPGTEAPGLGSRLWREAQVAASGFNLPWETLVGAPVDAATNVINRIYGTVRGDAPMGPPLSPLLRHLAPPAPTADGTAQPPTADSAAQPPGPLITDPFLGSQMLRRTFSPTQPEGLGENLLYKGAAGVGSVVGPGLIGGALRAGGAALPSIADAMLPPVTAGGTAIAGVAGVGGEGARELAAKTGAPRLVQQLAEFGGNLATGLPTAVAARSASQLVRPFTRSGQEQVAGKALSEATTMTPGEIENAVAGAPAGVQPTLGDITGELPVQAIQRTMGQRDLAVGGALQRQASANNQAILDNFDRIGTPAKPLADISQDVAARLETTRAAQQKAASDAFKAVPSDQTMVPTSPLMDAYVNYAGQLGPARQRFLPDTYQNLLSGYADQEPLSELQNFSSALKTEARAAGSGANPDYNRANVLNGLHDALFPGGGPEDLLTPAQGPIGDALRQAKQQWQQYKQTYNDPPAIKKVLQPDAYGSSALDRLLGPGAGQAERAKQFVAAAQNDPTTLQAARDWVSGKMQAAGASAGQDLQGNQLLNGNQLRRFRDGSPSGGGNLPLINSSLFDDTHRQAINDIVDAANMMQSTARGGTPGGSDTFRNLTTERYLQGLGVGPIARGAMEAAPAAAGAGIGGAIGHVFGEPGWGALIGSGPGGGAIGRGLVSSILPYDRAREAVLGKIAGGLTDPREAARLMRLGSPPAAPGGPASPLRSYMALPGVYGAVGGY
ncbi:MAG TPA: hypothetical protein VGF39_03935 [Stellaceae bacterium]|jgi:hypothetical protein